MPVPSELLDSLMAKYVSPDGLVDYAAMRDDGPFCANLKTLLEIDASRLAGREERMAYWINAYNAAVLCAMIEDLKRDPRLAAKGNGGVFRRLHFFVLRRHRIGGKKMSLWTLENRLRREFRDPRIHFALVCASNGCPVLREGLYSAEDLDSELDSAARLFINSPRGAVLDREARTLAISQIFKWYRSDFRSAGGVVPFITRHLPPEDAGFVRQHRDRLEIRFLPYDWHLNAAEETRTTH